MKIWREAEQIGSLEHAVKRRKSKKEAQKMRALLQMAAGEGKGKRLDVESEHSWSSVWSLTHGYTRWWVERARTEGAFTLPQAVSKVMLFKKWLHWKEPAAAACWGNLQVTTLILCLTPSKPALSSLNMQSCAARFPANMRDMRDVWNNIFTHIFMVYLKAVWSAQSIIWSFAKMIKHTLKYAS